MPCSLPAFAVVTPTELPNDCHDELPQTLRPPKPKVNYDICHKLFPKEIISVHVCDSRRSRHTPAHPPAPAPAGACPCACPHLAQLETFVKFLFLAYPPGYRRKICNARGHPPHPRGYMHMYVYIVSTACSHLTIEMRLGYLRDGLCRLSQGVGVF